tara:strand:+ start:947 stop:2065 length:1119 start_codon:yes stop_codon:yes gene_type:complete
MINSINIKDMIGNLDGHLGEDDYSKPLEILIKSANKNNKFNLFGAFAFKNQLKDRLKMRSKLHNFMKDKVLPSPADPIFVTGLPRSGTTFLFNLLALDKNHRSPKYWEIMSPLPLTKNNFDIKIREWKINAELKFARTIIPKLKSMHHIRAQTPEECELLATINVRSFVYMCMANVPEYVEYLKDCSFESVFMWHKKFFQMLELNGRPERWLLKDPSHIGHIPEILSTYPNAKFINIHRSPMESIASFCSLAKNIRSAFSKNVNKKEIGAVILDFWQHSLNKGIDAKEELSEDQFIDLSYSNFINNPLLAIKDIYEKFGLYIDIETENRMKQYLMNQTKIKKQKHNYSLQEYGISERNINDHLKNYIMNNKF